MFQIIKEILQQCFEIIYCTFYLIVENYVELLWYFIFSLFLILAFMLFVSSSEDHRKCLEIGGVSRNGICF